MDMFYSDSEPDDPARPSIEDLDEVLPDQFVLRRKPLGDIPEQVAREGTRDSNSDEEDGQRKVLHFAAVLNLRKKATARPRAMTMRGVRSMLIHS